MFLSYATDDSAAFQIPRLVASLESHPQINKVWYWDRDSGDYSSIIAYMEAGIRECDVLLALSTPASLTSNAVNQEIDLAIYMNKRIVPVFERIEDVRLLLRPKTGVKYNPRNFNETTQNMINLLFPRAYIPKSLEISNYKVTPHVHRSNRPQYTNKKKIKKEIGRVAKPQDQKAPEDLSPTSQRFAKPTLKRNFPKIFGTTKRKITRATREQKVPPTSQDSLKKTKKKIRWWAGATEEERRHPIFQQVSDNEKAIRKLLSQWKNAIEEEKFPLEHQILDLQNTRVNLLRQLADLSILDEDRRKHVLKQLDDFLKGYTPT